VSGMRQDGAVNPGRRVAWAAGLALALLAAAGCARGQAPAKAVPLRAAPVLPGRVSVSHVRTADGSKITIAAFSGSVTYVLHNGSADPGRLLAGQVTAGPIGHQEYVARSALGENAAGDLIYAASMSTSPEDLARALAAAGAVVAMELDINPEWVQLDVASRPGGPLTAAIPSQHRPATQYLTGWTRDFIAVLAPPAVPPAVPPAGHVS
jgi:hypothetical protein